MPTNPSLVTAWSRSSADVFLSESGQEFCRCKASASAIGDKPGVLGFFQPSQNGPHRRHFDRVRRDVFVGDTCLLVVVLLIDANLVFERRHVRNIDLHRTIAEALP